MKHSGRFERLCSLMAETPLLSSTSSFYETLCRQVGISEAEADNMFYEEFGMSGEEILAQMAADGADELRIMD